VFAFSKYLFDKYIIICIADSTIFRKEWDNDVQIIDKTEKVQPLAMFDNYVNSSLCQDKEACDYANNGIKE
jgi:hypothetical protein